MSKLDLAQQCHQEMRYEMLEDMEFVEKDIECQNCGHYDEEVDGDKWTYLCWKRDVCPKCFKDLLDSIDEYCPFCNGRGCNDCLL